MFELWLTLQLWFAVSSGLTISEPFSGAIGCSINLSTDIPKFEPVILTRPDATSSYTLFKPLGQTTILPVGTELLLACTGTSNSIQSLQQSTLELRCHANNQLMAANHALHKLKNLGCKSIPVSVLQKASESCANATGHVYEVGFLYRGQEFVPVFRICYDNSNGRTFYTQHLLNGAAIEFSIQEKSRRAFRADGMIFITAATNSFYKQTNQMARFEKYFGASQSYISTSNFLARGHLSPDADFIFSYEQLATYFYMNSAPEWRSINAGNWLRVENLARRLAAAHAGILEVYNGLMGLLELPHPKTKTLIPIYLAAPGHMEAPRFFFKVLKHQPSDAAIVLITLNNPFATVAEAARSEFCVNICARAGVWNNAFADTTKGYTFCCKLNDFKQHFPVDVAATHLLTNPSLVDKPKPSSPMVKRELKTGQPTQEGCKITLPTDIPTSEPVYVISTSTEPQSRLLYPSGEITELPVGTNLILYCAGSGNQLIAIGQQTLTLTCAANNTFYSAEKRQYYKLKQLNCTRVPTSDLLVTNVACANANGSVYEAGFTLNKDFLNVFTMCYNSNDERTVYTRNIINGATQNFKINDNTRRAFRADGTRFTTTALNNYYTNNNQRKRFELLFGVHETYVNTTSFLARGHLTPDADFVFAYEQLATYFYTNCEPEWQAVNAGNWVRVENTARKLAAKFGSDLLTFTSTLGVLQLPHPATNKLTSIYLDDAKLIAAPMWYYKLVLHPQLPVDLVFITLNNPFADAASVVEFCRNVCEQYGVGSSYYKDASRGYTFCCTLQDFAKAVPDLPTFDLPAGWSFKN